MNKFRQNGKCFCVAEVFFALLRLCKFMIMKGMTKIMRENFYFSTLKNLYKKFKKVKIFFKNLKKKSSNYQSH